MEISCYTHAGSPVLLPSREDFDGSGEEIDLAGGMFDRHDIALPISNSMVNNSIDHMVWVGGKDDWLVISDTGCQIKLFNPISGVMINLPSFSTIGAIENCNPYSVKIVYDPCSRNLRRIVLYKTPFSVDGIFAIGLFSDGLLAYVTQGLTEWKLLKHHTEYEGCYRYFPEVYMDALVHNGRIVAVDEEGSIFSWNIEDDGSYPDRIESPVFLDVERSTEEVYYLAESCTHDLILICLYGHGDVPYKQSFNRALISEHERFLKLDAMSIHKLDGTTRTWSQIHKIGDNATLFLGLNYHLYGTWDGIKPNSIYFGNFMGSDVMIIDMEDETTASVEQHNYPVEEHRRLMDGHSIRSPMWFCPTKPCISE